jgi:hypothetical protein
MKESESKVLCTDSTAQDVEGFDSWVPFLCLQYSVTDISKNCEETWLRLLQNDLLFFVKR